MLRTVKFYRSDDRDFSQAVEIEASKEALCWHLNGRGYGDPITRISSDTLASLNWRYNAAVGQLWMLSGPNGVLGYTTGKVVLREALKEEVNAPIRVEPCSSITDHGHCGACGYRVISVPCNAGNWDELDADGHAWDWWMYCSNKTCVHHAGTGYFQNDPAFLVREPR